MSDIPKGWLGRETRARNFTKIIQSDTRPRVISIEGGFGYGKTIFAKKWAEMLKAEGETVIQFDAWATDHTDDPLVAFVGKLLEAMPHKPPSKWTARRKKAVSGMFGLAKVGGITATKFLAGGILADALAEGMGFGDGSDGKEMIEKLATAVAGEASAQTFSLLGAQMVMERARKKDLPAQLAALREELESAKDEADRKGRIVVVIDELDRCRPDYAIALLEAIKHLFHQKGYVFVLMINPEQLARTAGRLYGKVGAGEEPYMAKFLDIRLDLGEPDYEALIEQLVAPLESRFVPLTDASEMKLRVAAEHFASFAASTRAKPRQIDSAVRQVDVALAVAADQHVDPTWLLCNSLRLVMSDIESASLSEPKLAYLPPWWLAGLEFVEQVRIAEENQKRQLSSTRNLTTERQIRESYYSALHELAESTGTALDPLLGADERGGYDVRDAEIYIHRAAKIDLIIQSQLKAVMPNVLRIALDLRVEGAESQSTRP